MRIIVCENYEEVSKKAAQMILSQVTLKPNSVLGLATGLEGSFCYINFRTV